MYVIAVIFYVSFIIYYLIFNQDGKFSVLGRSVVVLTPNGGGDRFACANIEPDHDLVKFIVIHKPPKFVA